MEIRVTSETLAPWRLLAEYEAAHPGLQGAAGGLATFVGTMRDNNEGDAVQTMELQHYPGMTEKYLQCVAEEAMAEWGLLDALIVHRHGPMQPGDPIVLVAAWAAHRAEAFAACRYMIDELKTRAPFWKRETTQEGQRWVTRPIEDGSGNP